MWMLKMGIEPAECRARGGRNLQYLDAGGPDAYHGGMAEREKGRWGAFVAIVAAALGIVQFYRPASPAPTEPFAAIRARALSAGASLNAFGDSREVRLRFALPASLVEFPLEVSGDVTSLAYEWIAADDSTQGSGIHAVSGASFVSPSAPGYYHLAIVRGTQRQIIAEPTLAVMVPFRDKIGASLNGYRIGTYLAERLTGHDHPPGFLEVNRGDVDRRVSTHLRLGDFLTRDHQEDVWPKYVALNPRLLDKLELVFAHIGAQARFRRAASDSRELAFDVHSGFRTPAHNRGVWRAASDSRHQYGDAADLAIDADGDGRITARDEALVVRAVDEVENEHPDLVGGLGLYTSAAYNTPYVHIDARGSRSRWKG
jgi:uncharacterized protein YcbK (DUF882 family)